MTSQTRGDRVSRNRSSAGLTLRAWLTPPRYTTQIWKLVGYQLATATLPIDRTTKGRARILAGHRPFLVVGLTGFEPATPCPPDKCANQAALQPVVSRNSEPIRRLWQDDQPLASTSSTRSGHPARRIASVP